jgi:hypothetical protein
VQGFFTSSIKNLALDFLKNCKNPFIYKVFGFLSKPYVGAYCVRPHGLCTFLNLLTLDNAPEGISYYGKSNSKTDEI